MYNDRQNEIIRYLSRVKFAKINQLSDMFGVSTETIRRDLLELERDSAVKRLRGGAVYNNLRAQEIEYEKKLEVNTKEKLAIARTAVDYINDGDALAVGNGTSSLAFARCLVERKNGLTIITNSPDIAGVLNENMSNNIYLTAGLLRKHNKSLVGSASIDCLGKFRVDKSIVSIDGVSLKDGITEYNTEEAAVIKKMLEISHTRFVLCEFSKFSEVALNIVCSAEQVDYIFTDWNVPVKTIKAWADIGVQLITPSRSSQES